MERDNDKVSWKMIFNSDFRSVIGWLEGDMTFDVMEITMAYHHITMTIYHHIPPNYHDNLYDELLWQKFTTTIYYFSHWTFLQSASAAHISSSFSDAENFSSLTFLVGKYQQLNLHEQLPVPELNLLTNILELSMSPSSELMLCA